MNNDNIKITEEDLLFMEKELSKNPKPLSLTSMTKKLAYKKTSSQLNQEVKKYDPYCKYEVGNLIYKEYDEPLTVSSKGVESFKGAVILKVVNKAIYNDFDCEMLEIDYSGGGIFRKYIDYMKKAKTQVLLPSNLEKKAKIPEKMEKKEDPRLTQLPMTNKDFKTLEKNLKAALSKSSKFFNWDEHWYLAEKQIEIKEEKIKKIKSHLLDTKQSVTTNELVNKFFNIDSLNDLFELYCMSLNSALEKKHKKDFINVSPLNWGKWHLKKIIQSFPENLPLFAPKAELLSLEEKEKGEITQAQNFPLKIYVTWREILSGGIKIPNSLHKEFSHAREHIFTDIEEGKDYTVYYYPSEGIFLGLKDFFEHNNVPQGASLTLEREESTRFSFWLKKSKKKLSVLKIVYDPKEDVFSQSGEEFFTYSLPNKIIHLERETLTKLLSFYQQRGKLGLRELLVLVFKNFGLESHNLSLHYLRAYHLVDILKHTTQEDVENTLLNSPEFFHLEKNKGIFFYQEKIVREAKAEEQAIITPILPSAEKIEEVVAEEMLPPEVKEEEKEEARVIVTPEIQEVSAEEKFIFEKKPEPEEKPWREKGLKKRKLKMEIEKPLRGRKGEKRFIEEKIELEESEQEALRAIKAKEKKDLEEERIVSSAKEKKEEFKTYTPKEPVFGVFAEKLKTALDKKKKEPK